MVCLLSNIKKFSSYIMFFFRENVIVFLFIVTLLVKGIFFGFSINAIPEYPDNVGLYVATFLTVFAIFMPLFFVKKYKFTIAIIINIFLTLLLIIDEVYFRFFHTLPSVGILNTIGQVGEEAPAIFKLVRLQDFYFFIDIVIILFLNKMIKAWASNFTKEKLNARIYFIFKLSIIFFEVILLFLFFSLYNVEFRKSVARGSSNNKIVAQEYGVFAAHIIDVYQIVSENFRVLSVKDKKDTVAWIKENSYKAEDNAYTGAVKGKNIIMIQVESLQEFPVGKKIEGQEITPNINALISKSNYFEDNYFEMGAGGHTSDIDFVANTSLFPLPNESVFVKYGTRDYTSLPKEAKNNNYSAYAFHANNRGFWNRDVAFKSLGFDKFFAEENYAKGEDIFGGLNDKDFLLQTADYIKSQPKPSFSYVITLSSHFPFGVWGDNQHLKIPGGKYPDLSANYLQSIRYTDEALGGFFNKLKKDHLYDDSLIILYGDHNAQIDNFSFDGVEYNFSDIDSKKVPLVIKFPNQEQGVVRAEASSHIDLMPTVLNLMNVKTSAPMFGRDLFSDTRPFFASIDSFNVATVVDGDTRYQLADDSKEICEQKDLRGVYSSTNKDDCAGLSEKRTKLFEENGKLVRYNLFNMF